MPIVENMATRILIVEDEFVSRQLLRKLLGSYGECDVAVDGQEALEAIQIAHDEGRPYQLVTLDIMMPNIDGQEALKAIRQNEEKLSIAPNGCAKIIMTSSLQDPKNVLGAFRSGCEAYLTKPIERQTLVAKLKELGLAKL